MQHFSVRQVCVCTVYQFHFSCSIFEYINVLMSVWCNTDFSVYWVCRHQCDAAVFNLSGVWASVSCSTRNLSLAIYHSARCMGVSFSYSCSILQSIRCVNIGFMQHFAVCQVWASVSCSILQSIRCVGVSFMPHFSIYQVCGHQFHAAFCNLLGVWASVSCSIFQFFRYVGVSFMQLSDSATTCRVTSKAKISAVWSAASCSRVRNDLTPMPSYMMRRDESHSHVSTVGRWVTGA